MSKQTNHNGWIALHRKIQDNFLWKQRGKFSKLEAWIDILMEAQHSIEPQKVLIGMTVLTCNYGESLKSVKTWAKRWGWSRNKVYRFFELLKKQTMIATKTEHITTRLTVCNYKRYDPKQNTNGTQNRTQADTDNNDNNVYSPNSDEFRLAELLFSEIQKRKPNFHEPNLQKWAIHIDRLIRLNKRTPEQIETVIKWCQADDFWQNNILSTEKLRKQIDQLELRMQKEGPRQTAVPLQVGLDGKTPRERRIAQIERNQ